MKVHTFLMSLVDVVLPLTIAFPYVMDESNDETCVSKD